MLAAYTQGWDAWKFGVWKVSVTGPNLEPVWHHLSAAKEIFIRESEDRRIAVQEIELEGFAEE